MTNSEADAIDAAETENAFDEDTRCFFQHMLEIEFLVRSAERETDNAAANAKEMLKAWNEKWKGDTPAAYGTAICLTIHDISAPKPRRRPFGRHMLFNEKMFALIEEMGARIRAHCISVVYEVFEEYLRSVAGRLLFNKREEWSLRKDDKFRKRKAEWAEAGKEETPDYYNAYVRFIASANCRDLLNELLAHMPDLKGYCEENWFRPEIQWVYGVLSCIRHSTVHPAGGADELDEQAYGRLQGWGKKLIDDCIKKSVLTGRKMTLPSRQHVVYLIECVSALVYALYSVASDECKMRRSTFGVA